jgi:hypothetical protein
MSVSVFGSLHAVLTPHGACSRRLRTLPHLDRLLHETTGMTGRGAQPRLECLMPQIDYICTTCTSLLHGSLQLATSIYTTTPLVYDLATLGWSNGALLQNT